MAFTKVDLGAGATQISWDAITGAVGGEAVELKGSKPVAGCVQVISGTAGSVALQGSNDGTNWATLKDLQGTDIALTALTALAEFTTSARYVRPLGNGSSSAAVVRMVVRG
ncbi:MAG: discoidin domain-containing protein [Candidatus Competibacteraceae bacterium]|nr:discoidin domain-containing protein [Candidatus Competibacteraceae bacterium]